MSTRPTSDQRARDTADTPESWVERHGDALFRYALQRVGDAAQAEDLVQETLLAALERRSSFDGRSAFRTWLTGILRHKIVDHCRRRSRAETPADERLLARWCDEQFDARGTWRKDLGTWRGDPATDEERRELTRALAACLEKLPRQTAEVFVLHEQRGVECSRLAHEIGISEGALRVRLYRARLALRECIDRRWFGAPGPDAAGDQ